MAVMLLTGCGFAVSYNLYSNAGFFDGFWHGLIAPYTLIVRFFRADVVMYQIPNVGWWYDFGFLLGELLCIPLGWIATIISFFI